MSIVTIKNRVLCSDSLVTTDGMVVCKMSKCAKVPERFGGGYAASVGDAGESTHALSVFVDTGECPLTKHYQLVHLQADGTIREYNEGWMLINTDNYAIGSGFSIALGAMEAGASSESACRIAAKLNIYCGGKINVCRLKRVSKC